MRRSLPVVLFAVLLTLPTYSSIGARQAQPSQAQNQAQPGQAQTPHQFFGFRIGTDGELARYPKILEYLQHLSKATTRVKFQELGKTTMGNPYVLATDQRAGKPREAREAHRDQSAAGRSARPDAKRRRKSWRRKAGRSTSSTDDPLDRGRQHAGADRDRAPARDRQRAPTSSRCSTTSCCSSCRHRTPTARCSSSITGTRRRARRSRASTRTCITSTSGTTTTATGSCSRRSRRGSRWRRSTTRYKPIITHDMHQQGTDASRIFVPPFDDPYDPNVHPILAQGITSVGQRHGLGARRRGQDGVEWLVALRPLGAGAAVHGLPRSAAHPDRDRERQSRRSVRQPGGETFRLGRRRRAGTIRCRTRAASGGSRQIVDYANTAAFAGIGARREEPGHLARELLQGSRRLGEPEDRAVRVRPPSGAARSVRDL